MHVELWMTADPLTIGPGESVAVAGQTMSRRKVRRLPVVDGGRLVGIVSELDVARAFPPDVNPFSATVESMPGDRKVGDIMTSEPLTAAPHTPVDEAAHLMADRHVGALPVVLGGRLVGIITESDVFRAFVELVGVRDRGARVTFDVSVNEDVLTTVAPLARSHGLRVASLLTLDHDGRRFAVVRVAGARSAGFIDAVWKSGHRVVSVVEPTDLDD